MGDNRNTRITDDAVIRMKTDKDGKHYGPKNNPKREGSSASERFAKYREGMTVKAAKEAGITASDVRYDSDHGYIEVRVPTPAGAA